MQLSVGYPSSSSGASSEGAPQKPEQKDKRVRDPSTASGNSIVWVLDREHFIREGVCQLMKGAGYGAKSFSQSSELLAELDRGAPQCIIAETGPETLSGSEFIRSLRQAGYDIPVIILAEESDVPSAVNAMRAGAVDFMEKPFVDRLLLKRVQQALQD